MLIPLFTLIKKHKLQITGVIHVGAHWAEEHEDYEHNHIQDIVYVEPCAAAFRILSHKRFNPEKVKLFNTALADYEGRSSMYVERANNGQSNSLLEPGTHTKHYPLIKFQEKEYVSVTTLDALDIERPRYNFLNIDVQGTELLVLKGGVETLKGIDYIYLEVNKEAVYEGCAMVEEIDSFLKDFRRAETIWTGQGWGDALYLRKEPVELKVEFSGLADISWPKKLDNVNILPVPSHFRPNHPFPYPEDNDVDFERWLFQNLSDTALEGKIRVYLPVFWTAFYVKNKYGKDIAAMKALQKFLNGLDTNKRYFTVCQYDDGILNDISHLDIQIFGMSGGRIDYPLPLICKPHKFEFPGIPKDILCSYVGTTTHPIRKRLLEELSGKKGFYISDKKIPLSQFCNILARSKYVLCPRGYGKTSFRIGEALQYGATPIYISDEFILPHNLDFLSVAIEEEQIIHLPTIINNWKVNVKDNKMLFETYFTYESNMRLIIENIK